MGVRRGAALVARRIPRLRLASAELRGRSGDRGRDTLRSGGRRNPRDRRASRLGCDPAAPCRTARLRADAVPAATGRALASNVAADGRDLREHRLRRGPPPAFRRRPPPRPRAFPVAQPLAPPTLATFPTEPPPP